MESANGGREPPVDRQADSRTGAESPSGHRRSNRNYSRLAPRSLSWGFASSMVRRMRIGLWLMLWSGVLLAQTAEPPKYTGPGSCASPSCHGAVQVRIDTSVQQNEYS